MEEETKFDEIYKYNLNKKIKTTLMGLGFDFGLNGSHYLQEVLLQVLLNPKKIHNLSSMVMAEMICGDNISVKSIDKDIRWAIQKAYKVGILNKISFFNNNIPTIKQFINWIFDFFNV